MKKSNQFGIFAYGGLALAYFIFMVLELFQTPLDLSQIFKQASYFLFFWMILLDTLRKESIKAWITQAILISGITGIIISISSLGYDFIVLKGLRTSSFMSVLVGVFCFMILTRKE